MAKPAASYGQGFYRVYFILWIVSLLVYFEFYSEPYCRSDLVLFSEIAIYAAAGVVILTVLFTVTDRPELKFAITLAHLGIYLLIISGLLMTPLNSSCTKIFLIDLAYVVVVALLMAISFCRGCKEGGISGAYSVFVD